MRICIPWRILRRSIFLLSLLPHTFAPAQEDRAPQPGQITLSPQETPSSEEPSEESASYDNVPDLLNASSEATQTWHNLVDSALRKHEMDRLIPRSRPRFAPLRRVSSLLNASTIPLARRPKSFFRRLISVSCPICSAPQICKERLPRHVEKRVRRNNLPMLLSTGFCKTTGACCTACCKTLC